MSLLNVCVPVYPPEESRIARQHIENLALSVRIWGHGEAQADNLDVNHGRFVSDNQRYLAR